MTRNEAIKAALDAYQQKYPYIRFVAFPLLPLDPLVPPHIRMGYSIRIVGNDGHTETIGREMGLGDLYNEDADTIEHRLPDYLDVLLVSAKTDLGSFMWGDKEAGGR